LKEVEEAKKLFSEIEIIDGDDRFTNVQYTLLLLEWEALIEVGDWKVTEAKAQILQSDDSNPLPLVLWEQLTDMLWRQKNAPEALVLELLQASIPQKQRSPVRSRRTIL